MRGIRLLAAVAVVVAPCAATAGAAETSDRASDAFSAAFARLADRMRAQERTRPGAAGRAATARPVAAEDGPAPGLAQRAPRTEDLEAALERLKAIDGIGLRNAYRLDPDEDALGLRIPLSDKTAIVPSYDFDRRDVGMAGTDGDRAHSLRIGASLRF